MKTFVLATLLSAASLTLGTSAQAQFRANEAREEAERRPSNTLGAMTSEDDGIFSKLFNMNNWSTHQTYSFSYASNGSQSMGLSMFTNTFEFRPSDDMIFSADVSAVYSPFSSFGSQYQKQINGIYLTNARLDWKLGENTFLMVGFSNLPEGANYYSPFGSNAFGRYYNPFERTDSRQTVMSGTSSFGPGGWHSTTASVSR